MLQLKFIESAQNESLKEAKRWMAKSAELRSEGLAAIEGLHLAKSVLDSGLPIESVWLPHSKVHDAEWEAMRKPLDQTDAVVYVLPDHLYAKLSQLPSPTGPLIVFRRPAPRSKLNFDHPILVLDGVQDPGNLGTMLRVAAAAHIQQVVTNKTSAWAWGDKALRAGMGAQFALDLQEGQADELLRSIQNKQCDLPVVVTSLSPETQSLYATDLNRPVIWVFGSEGQGVSSDWLSVAQIHLKIPQSAAVESLNVASSCAICLFEQVRQSLVVL